MINDLQEVQWAYLLDPAFELVNTAGKPLTDGYIEVYIHGTRNKYYCASDFDGTLHPFKIPLDALGANIVLASPAHSYDVYVYNKFGSLVMSRYNIQPKTGSGEIVHDDITVSSNDGSVQIVTSGQTNYDLSIQDTVDRVDVVESSITNLATSIEEITNVVTAHDVDIEELKANKKDKQEEYVAIGGPTKTITKVEQDEDGKMTVTYEDIDLPQAVPNVEITSPNGTINIASSIDVATNTKTFEIDVDGHEPDWHYWTGNNAWTIIRDGAWTDINRPTMGAGKAPHSWTPEVKLGVYDAKADFTVTFHNQSNSYKVPNQIIQIGFRAKLVGKNNADAIRYIDLGSFTYDPSLYTTEPYQFNFAQESLRQNYSTSKIMYVPTYVGDTDFYIYYQAALLNTDGSQNVTAIDPVCRAEITYFGYHEVVGSITGTASGGTTLYAGSGIDIDEDRINVNIGEGLTIVNNNVSIDKSVVLAKDNLVAGDNITITASGDNLIISSDADVSELATKDELASAVDNLQDQIDNIPEQVQSDWTEDDQSSKAYIQNKPDLSEFATKTELGSAVDALQDEIDNIPAQVQSDWTEADVDDPAYIQHKPIEKALVAGENITITDIGSAIEISSTGGGASGTTYTAGDGIDITNDVISVDNIISANADTSTLATKTELGSAINELQSEINDIPAQVQANWNEADQSSKAYIQNKPSIPTKTSDLQNDSGFATTSDLEAYIPYSASGVELPNSNFEIGVDGQAYKLSEETIAKSPTFINYGGTGVALTKLETGVTYTLTAQGATQWSSPAIYNHASGTAYDTHSFLFDNNVCTFTWPYETATVRIRVDGVSMNASNTTITYVKASKERYILESELASAIPDVSNFVTNDELASAIDAIEAEIPDVSTLATKTELGSAIDELQSEINNIPTPTTYTGASGVNVDNDTISLEDPIGVIAGEGITFTASGDDIIISSTGGGGSQVQADWTEDDSSDPSYIQNKPTEKNLVAGTNVTITETNDDVIVNTTEIASGAELVAGSGINIEEVGNTIRISQDETVLYTANNAVDSITTSEEVTHFERLRIETKSNQSTYIQNCYECKPDSNNLVYTATALIPAATYPLQVAGIRYTSSNAKDFTFSSATRMCYMPNATYGDSTTTSFASSDIKDVGFITKIVGINRISN